MAETLDDHLLRLEAAAAKAARWVARHQAADGTPPAETEVIESSYKGMWALLLSGYSQKAVLLADWSAGRINGDGDLPTPRNEAAFLTGHYLYANGYATIGASLLGRFDLARPMMDFIGTRQNPATGGFWSNGPGVATTIERTDTVSTAICAWAALFMNRLDVARHAGEYLAAAFDNQPFPEREFLSTAGADGMPLTNGLPGEGHVHIDIRDPEQDWYFIGLPSLVLASLHIATGEARWLEYACAYLDYLDTRCHAGAFLDFSSGKSGAAAAHLYRLTGRSRYRQIALNVADFVISKQSPWGFFCEDVDRYGGPPTSIAWSDLDMTFEYVLWLKLTAMHLVERP